MASRSMTQSADDNNDENPVTARLVVRLLELIDSGALQPGQQLLPERELAQKMKVSRQSLRTSIASLAMIGVLKSRHGSGTFVSPGILTCHSNSAHSLGGIASSQLFEARLRIEAALIELAVLRFTQIQLGNLAEEIVEMFAALDDRKKYTTHYMRFHRIIARAAGNAVLYAMFETISANLASDRLQQTQPLNDLRESASIHREIYKAIRSRDPFQARLLMERHLEHSRLSAESEPNLSKRKIIPAASEAEFPNGTYR